VLTKDVRDAILARFEIIGDEPDALVFKNIQTGCRHGFAKAKAIAKIKNFIMKDLRATFATNALDVLPISQVSKYLGHKNPQITMRYLRPTASSHQDNVTRFESHMINRQTIQESATVN
jgi:integrase